MIIRKRTLEQIADLIRRVSVQSGDKRGGYCGFDLMLQWRAGKLKETMAVWEKDLISRAAGQPEPQTDRNGIWVPAIPVKG